MGKQDARFADRIGLFLGHTEYFDFDLNNFKHFYIYIHEKGQFWPREDLFPMLSVFSGTEMEARFNIREVKGLGIRLPFVLFCF